LLLLRTSPFWRLANMPPTMQTIVLLRHGYLQSWDDRPKGRGVPPHLRIDPALAELGRRQAGLAAARIASADAVLCSPFRSCLETADAIAATTTTTITGDWKLGEILISSVLGVPYSPTMGMDPDWAERRVGAGKPSHPESDRTVQERIAKTVNELKARKPFAGRLVIVSHDTILKALVAAMTGRAVTLDWHPCGLATLVRAKPADRQWRVTGLLGDVGHLGADDRCEPTEDIIVKYHPDDSRA
jgi:broad specificity phosphatase PhoE